MVAGKPWAVVVGDTWCIARLHRVIEPEKALPSTKFLMHINATIRRLKHHDGDDLSFDDEQEELIDVLLEEENWSYDEKDVTVELEYCDNVNVEYFRPFLICKCRYMLMNLLRLVIHSHATRNHAKGDAANIDMGE